MKKIILLFLVFQLAIFSFASDDHGGLMFNVGIGFMFPVFEDGNTGENVLGALALSTFALGMGYSFDIVEHSISPGIYADLHLSFLSHILSGDDEDNINDETQGTYFHTGLRVYNNFSFNAIDIQPFYGINFIFGTVPSVEPVFLNVFGVFFTFNKTFISEYGPRFGLEYSYQIPSPSDNEYLFRVPFHRILLILRII